MRLSIITINFNNIAGLKETIKSVIAQTDLDFEYIIIDGASTDGSVDVIKENVANISYWVSEPDTGIYNAMNKGVQAAHGDYCLFLNSGDILIDKYVIERVLSNKFAADIVSGNIKCTNGTMTKAPHKVSMKTFIVGSLPHQATLIKRDLLLKNPYDERFKIGGDWRFFIQVLIYENVSYERIPITISLFDTSGVSNTESKESERRLYEQELCRDILPSRIEQDYKFAFFIAKWKWRLKKLYILFYSFFVKGNS